MSEEDKKNKTPKEGEGQDKKTVDINVKVSGGNTPPAAQTSEVQVDPEGDITKLQKQLEKVTKEAAEAKEKLEAELAKTKTLTEEKGTLTEDKGDLEAKLKLVAEKEYKKKCEIMIAKGREIFKDPKTGEVDEEKIKDMETKFADPEKGPENLKMEEYMIGHLTKMLKKGAEEAKTEKEKKAKEAGEKKKATEKAGSEAGAKATGQAKLTGEEATGEGQGGETPESYDSYVAMVQDLRRRARDPSDPEKQAEATAQLKELWLKWAKMTKADYLEAGLKGKEGYSPEKKKHEGKSIRQIHKEGA